MTLADLVVNYALELEANGATPESPGLAAIRMNRLNSRYATKFKIPRRWVQMPEDGDVTYPTGFTTPYIRLPDEASPDGLISLIDNDTSEIYKQFSVGQANQLMPRWADPDYNTAGKFVIYDPGNVTAPMKIFPNPSATEPKYFRCEYFVKVKPMTVNDDQPFTGVDEAAASVGEISQYHEIILYAALWEFWRAKDPQKGAIYYREAQMIEREAFDLLRPKYFVPHLQSPLNTFRGYRYADEE